MSNRDAQGRPQRRSASGSGAPFPWLAELTAVLAHELGNSMTALAFATDALREQPARRPEPSELDELCSVVAKSSTLVRMLARLAATSATPAVRLDVREVVSDAEALFQRLANGRLRSVLPDTPVPLVAARSDLERALVELVITARDRAAAGAVHLSVERGQDRAIRITVETTAAAAPLAPDSLRSARALALACGGSLDARQPHRIELSLPSAPR